MHLNPMVTSDAPQAFVLALFSLFTDDLDEGVEMSQLVPWVQWGWAGVELDDLSALFQP